jgi:hypothetical protein
MAENCNFNTGILAQFYILLKEAERLGLLNEETERLSKAIDDAKQLNKSPAPVQVAPPAEPSVSSNTNPIGPDALAFAKGKHDRMSWENFVASVVGDARDGANWWAGRRSLKAPGSCSFGPTAEFRRGCEEAQAMLGPSDVLRKTSPAYREGWNSL